MSVQVVDDRSQVWYGRGDKRVVDLSLREGDVEGLEEGEVCRQTTLMEGAQAERDDDNNG